MNQHKFERIDKGQKRALPPQPRTDKGVYLPVCTPEKREEIITYSLTALATGETTDEIADKYSIDGSTLRRWLLTDDLLKDTADKARKHYYDGELSTAREEIRSSETPFTLARAREDFRAVSWLAERRLPQFYAQKQEVKHTGNLGPLINIQLSGVQVEKPIESTESTQTLE